MMKLFSALPNGQSRNLWLLIVSLAYSQIGIQPLVAQSTLEQKQPFAESRLSRFEFSIPSMGSNLDFAVYASNANVAEHWIQIGLNEVERLSLILSNYDSQSEVVRLCASNPNQPVVISHDLQQTLLESKRWCDLSEGKFDITIGPLIQQWKTSRKQLSLPSVEALDRARTRCGWQHVTLDTNKRNAMLDRPDMVLDLSGIAVGYIVDRAFEKMQAAGAHSFLINAGGDIRVGAPPPGKTGWRIEISGLGKDSPCLSVLTLASCAVTTSGDLFQFVEIDGRRFSHFVDPDSAHAVERRQSVTVVASNTVDADAGATALAILGPECAAQLFDRLPLEQATIIDGTDSTNPVKLRYLRKEKSSSQNP